MVSVISRRVSDSLTDRPGTARAASTASTDPACSVPLVPNPPPTCGETTVTSSSPIPNNAATWRRASQTACEASNRVRCLPSQRATVECGSIGWWYSIGVR